MTRTLQDEIRSRVVEPQLHFTQAPVPNWMNTVPLYAVDTTVSPPVMTKTEREESQLMNKLELMVQNFIKGLGTDISDNEIMNRIVGFFLQYTNSLPCDGQDQIYQAK